MRVSTDAGQRTRGMNKGVDRERSELVSGTARPSLEGEKNFFSGESLQKIKGALKQAKQGDGPAGTKRPREPERGSSAPSMPPTGEVPGTSPVENTKSESTAVPLTLTSSSEGVSAEMPLELPSPPSCRALQSEAPLREALARAEKQRGLFADKLILAPLTTVGNLPFRRICKDLGADITISEMSVAYNLNRTQKSEWSLLRRHECENLFGIQLALSQPREAKMVAMALEASGFDYDYVDINAGCPIDAMMANGCGCALMERRGQRMPNVVKELATLQSQPVTLKCRIGADERDPSLHKEISHFESYGLSAVTIHGRSRRQRYTKLADWSYVEGCAQLTSLPVIGNGDILGWEDVVRHREVCPGVKSFMIGRGALIKPWLFQECKTNTVRDITSSERMALLKQFCAYGLSHWGSDTRGVMTTRRFLCEWLSFFCRYVPAGLLEVLPQRINERPPFYHGRDEMETLLSSASVADWIALSEYLLGPVEPGFCFTPKHRSNSYATGESDTTVVEG